jgi:hypothetical protein
MKRNPARNVNVALSTLIAFVVILSATGLAAKEIYSWSDEDGVPNFADLPPQGHESRSIEISDPVAMQSSTDVEEPEMATDPVEEPLAEGDHCSEHQDRLDTMLASRNISYIDESGQRRDLSDEQYELLIEESRTYLKLRCR